MATRKTTKPTSTKKTVRKTSTARRTTTTKTETAPKTLSAKTSSGISRIQLRDLILPGIIVVVIIFLGVFKNQFIVAEVNGQPITRLELINQLEQKDGKAILQNMVSEKLIEQEAKKRNIVVSDNDVKSEVAKIEENITSQGGNVDDVLAQQGMTRSDLSEQIKMQLYLKKMVPNANVTDKEVDTYFEQNADSIPAATNEAELKDQRDQVKQQLEQQKMSQSIQTFVTNLQTKAKIQYLHNY